MSVLTWPRFHDELDVRAGLYTQGRVISALTYRELQTRFGKMKFGIFWTLFEPVAYALFLVKLKSFMNQNQALGMGADNYELFLLTGILPYLFFRNMSQRAMSSITGNEAMLRLVVVTNLDVIFARLLLELFVFMLAVMVWFIMLWFMGLQSWPTYPLTFLCGFAATALFGAGVGTINAIVSVLFRWYTRFVPWLIRILFVTSGALFAIENRFPPEYVRIFEWNPLLHCVEWLRWGFFLNYQASMLSETYIIFVGGSLFLLGLLMERAFRRRVSVE